MILNDTDMMELEPPSKDRRINIDRSLVSGVVRPAAVCTDPDPPCTPDCLTEFCWLCHYHGERSTAEVVRLIMDSVTHISLEMLVDHCKFLLDHLDTESNASKAELKRHIVEHMLNPRVKLALQIQDMCKMQREIAKCCVVHDAETGGKTVDTQALRIYLSVSSQVTGIYKTSEEKLLYSGAAVDI
jgi:hypothetical protein